MNSGYMKPLLRYLLSALMIFAGFMHFAATASFARIVPRYLPDHRALVEVSGVCEIALALGLLIARTRRVSAWGLIALYIAVFPANINMAVNDLPVGAHHYPELLWLRLPLQAVLIAWAYWFTRT